MENLKILIENDISKDELDIDGDDEFEEGEIEEEVTDEHEPRVEVVLDKPPAEYREAKTYRNPKADNFMIGFDLTSEDEVKKREERAKRFGVADVVSAPLSREEIDALYSSFEMPPSDPDGTDQKGYHRLEALHVRGVYDMSTDDIFAYFGKYAPSSIEWIDDASCNVVWLEPLATARAILGMTDAICYVGGAAESAPEKRVTETEKRVAETVEKRVAESDNPKRSPRRKASERVDSDDEEMQLDLFDEEPMAANNTKEEETAPPVEAVEAVEAVGMVAEVVSEVTPEIPLPPGRWRKGKESPKAHELFMRFANRDDKKQPGAERRSRYYVKHGNPNYGGMRGLISNSRKRKMRERHSSQDDLEAAQPEDAHGRQLVVYDDIFGDPEASKSDENQDPEEAEAAADLRELLKRTGNQDDEDDEDEQPRKRRRDIEDDDEDEEPRRKMRVPADEEGEEPRGKMRNMSRRMVADEYEEQMRKKRLRQLSQETRRRPVDLRERLSRR